MLYIWQTCRIQPTNTKCRIDHLFYSTKYYVPVVRVGPCPVCLFRFAVVPLEELRKAVAVERKCIRRYLHPFLRNVSCAKSLHIVLQIEALHHAVNASGVVDEVEISEHLGVNTAGEVVEQPAPHAIPIRSHEYDGADSVSESVLPHTQYLRQRARRNIMMLVVQIHYVFIAGRPGGLVVTSKPLARKVVSSNLHGVKNLQICAVKAIES